MKGPYCPKCRVVLDRYYQNYNCSNCNKVYNVEGRFEELETAATKIFDAKEREKYEVISLDEPPTHVKVRDDDENYFLAAKIGQKDGKRVGVVYFGEKSKEQSKEDFSQIFVDLDDEQLRFDKSNKHPKNILCKFTAEFPDVIVEQKFKK